MRAVWAPAFAAEMAAISPAGPAPIMHTWVFIRGFRYAKSAGFSSVLW
jgi:hypothetical protein